MSKLKPIGSEKLQGDDKLKRIMEIARYNEVMPSSINENTKIEKYLMIGKKVNSLKAKS